MPHLILQYRDDHDFDVHSLLELQLPVRIRTDSVQIVYRSTFPSYRPGEGSLGLVEIELQECGATRRFLLNLVSQPNRLLLKLDLPDQVDKTSGVKAAVARFGELLVREFPGLSIGNTNVRTTYDTGDGPEMEAIELDLLHETEIPVDWDQRCENPRPPVVVVGFGRGDFLIHLANQTKPQGPIVGFEFSRSSMTRAKRRVIAASLLGQIQLVHLPAELGIGELFRPEGIAAVYINFPGPWPKARHADRRLIRAGFIDLLAEQLEPAGRIYIATDDPAYAVEIEVLFREWKTFVPVRDETAYHGYTPEQITKYGKRWARRGRKIHHFIYQKVAQPVPRPQDRLLHPGRPDAIRLPLTDSKFNTKRSSQVGRSLRDDSVFLKILAAFQGDGFALLKTRVVDIRLRFGFHQTVYWKVGPDEITLYPTGRPIPTVGLHRAPMLLGELFGDNLTSP
ncbi:MAG: tRNA (guanine(46)-N(7))-methyltransferase TrmB [Candidatus Bipolaricaulia bacterium]